MLGSSEVLKTALTVLSASWEDEEWEAELSIAALQPRLDAASITPACPPAARHKAHAELPWQVGNFQPGLK